MNDQRNLPGLWDDAILVSSYTDEQAVEDGFLVELGGNDRATRALYEYLRGLEITTPPDRVVVDLLSFMRDSALGILKGLVGTYGREARRIYEENVGGGIWTTELLGKTVWVIPNELGGMTAMFPEDY
jgi:hypothetical protein